MEASRPYQLVTPMSENTEQLFLAIGRLEGKMDSLLSMKQKLEDQVHQQDQRLRTLEHAKTTIFTIAGAISAAASVVVTYFTRLWT